MTLLKSIAVIYGLVAGLTRESTDVQVRAAYKKVSRKAHPDKGGAEEHIKAMNAARDTWEEALRAGTGRGKGKRRDAPNGPPDAAASAMAQRAAVAYRFEGLGVLLTYQKFSHEVALGSHKTLASTRKHLVALGFGV